MADDPQGLIEFPGLPVLTAGEFTLSHGIVPSVLSFTTVPSTDFVPQFGDMKIVFGDVEIIFKNCAIEIANLRRSGGGYIWSIMIKDRRWKWKYGRISGRYNIRRDDGSIDPATEKTPQELAMLLFDKLKEQAPDIFKLPNEARPECIWDAIPPANALQDLCDELNCRIVLGLDDKVTLWPLGEGEDLPENGLEINQGFGFKRSAKPDVIEVLGGPTQIQAKFKLVAVGEDTDGTIKPIDDLSYKPEDGWGSEWVDSFSSVVAQYQRDGQTLEAADLARNSVMKWYRIESFASGSWSWPPGAQPSDEEGQPIPDPKSAKDILPISDALLDMVAFSEVEGALEPKPLEIEGVFYPGGDDYQNTATGTKYSDDFSVDRTRGIIKFSNPVYKIDSDGSIDVPAELYLTAVFVPKHPDTKEPVRFYRTLVLPPPIQGTLPQILKHPEIIHKLIVRYVDTVGVVNAQDDNIEEINAEADHYLDAAAKEYELEESKEVEFTGILEIPPDGKVTQVTWKVGGGGATTRASVNSEHAKTIPYKEIRRRQKAAWAADQARDINRAFDVRSDRWNGGAESRLA